MRKIGIKLTQLAPLYILVFIAYGDAFLPQPLSDASRNTRETINKVLTGFLSEDMMENNKYDHKKMEKVIEEVEKY